MKSTDKATRHGFTLIEMAIVLVIIGLLVGGLVGIASYTKNARLSTMMNEAKYYVNAFNQFQTRYNGPPGDYKGSVAWTGAGDGDANGLIRAASVAIPNERWFVFQHLAFAGFIQGKFSGQANSNGGATIAKGSATDPGNVPGSSVDKSAFMFDHPDELEGFVENATVPNATYFDGSYGNVLIVAGLNDASAAVPALGFMTPKQALRLDEKYDDALPGQGNVTVQKTSAPDQCTNNNTTTATYYTTNDTKTCYFIIKMQ